MEHDRFMVEVQEVLEDYENLRVVFMVDEVLVIFKIVPIYTESTESNRGVVIYRTNRHAQQRWILNYSTLKL